MDLPNGERPDGVVQPALQEGPDERVEEAPSLAGSAASRQETCALGGIEEAASSLRSDLGGRGRILVRYSGTDNLVRVMVEGEDDAQIGRIAEELRNVLKDEIRG